MKLPALLLTATLAANAALLAVYLNRSSAAPSRSGSTVNSAPSASPPTASDSARVAKPVSAASTESSVDPQAWAALDSPDLATLVARLRAAGFPPSVIRAVVQSRLMATILPRFQEIAGTIEQKPFWATGRNQSIFSDPKFRAFNSELNRDYTKLLKDALGAEAYQNEEASDYQRRQYGEMPREKIDRLQQVVTDYNDLRSQIQLAANGLMLPEDREKLALLEKEKRADLAKILSPQELEEYLIRSSNTTSRLRAGLTAMNATEEEFRLIYKAQAAFDEKYLSPVLRSSPTTVLTNDLQADQARVADDIKLALGEQRFAEYARASDREFQTLSQVAADAKLPPSAAIQVYDLRTNLSTESNRIFADANLSNDQKRAALQTLAQTLRSQVTATLGESAARTYLQSATWLNRVEQGAAVTFPLGGGPSTRGLPPPRPGNAAPTANPVP